MFPDLVAPWSQADVARLLGVTEAAVSQWASAGLFDGCASGADMIRAVYQRRAAEAAGRAGELSEERARLARAQAENVEMKNAIMRREYAPVALLEEALGRTSRQMAGVLEALPVKLRRRSPLLSAEDIAFVEHEIAVLRNLAATVALDGDAPETADSEEVPALESE